LCNCWLADANGSRRLSDKRETPDWSFKVRQRSGEMIDGDDGGDDDDGDDDDDDDDGDDT